VYRVPIDLGFGCPHRSSDGSGGCAFCGAGLSRARHLLERTTVAEQVAAGVHYGTVRYAAGVFLAYVQAGTGTHAPVEILRKRYDEVLAAAPFRGLIIATRPDCLADSVLDLLGDLALRTDLWVELGVQSASDRTLKRINRGHDFACCRSAVRELTVRGVHVAAQVVLGLPGEGPDDFRCTAECLAELPFEAIKIHNLHIVRGTPLEPFYERGVIRIMNEVQYADVLIEFLRRTPGCWPVMRIVCDTAEDDLIAPKWRMSKGQFLKYVTTRMCTANVAQGDLIRASGTSQTCESADIPDNNSRIVSARLTTTDVRVARALAAVVRKHWPGTDEPRPVTVLNLGFAPGLVSFVCKMSNPFPTFVEDVLR